MATLKYEYEAYLEQTGTGAPVEKLLVKNTLPFSPVWAYSAAGNYSIQCTGAFSIDNTIIRFESAYQSEGANAGIIKTNAFIDEMPDKIYFIFADYYNVLTDEHRFWVHIKVYENLL